VGIPFSVSSRCGSTTSKSGQRYRPPTGVIRLEFIVGNMDVTAALGAQLLATVFRACNNDPRYGRCVLVEIPVPAGIILQPDISIALCFSGCGIPYHPVHHCCRPHPHRHLQPQSSFQGGCVECCSVQMTLLLLRLHWLVGAPRRKQMRLESFHLHSRPKEKFNSSFLSCICRTTTLPSWLLRVADTKKPCVSSLLRAQTCTRKIRCRLSSATRRSGRCNVYVVALIPAV